MFEKPSLIARIAVGKSIGLVFGVLAFIVLPMIVPDVTLAFRFGYAFWLIMMGGFIGLMGVMTYHPMLHLPLPWWFRGPLIGGFMMFNLWLVAGGQLDAIALAFFGAGSVFSNGAWSIVDGLVLGLIMSWLATQIGGEGKETVGR